MLSPSRKLTRSSHAEYNIPIVMLNLFQHPTRRKSDQRFSAAAMDAETSSA
jgi:hypothetical protein